MSLFEKVQGARSNLYVNEDGQAVGLLARVVGVPIRKDDGAEALLQDLDQFLRRDMTDFSRKGAPPHSAELLDSMEYELGRLREFCEFPGVAGKRVVALGGAFNAGKSSFINALFGSDVLPVDLTPTTAVPTYVIRAPQLAMCGLNAFGRKVTLDADALKAITHDFEERHRVGFGHLLKSVFIEQPGVEYRQLAFLDTPGYSKAEGAQPGRMSDEAIARHQLRSADAILWLVDAVSGTLPYSDVMFLQSLETDAPILILINKAEKMGASLASVVASVRGAVEGTQLNVRGIYRISAHEPTNFDLQEVQAILRGWNAEPSELTFIRNFKQVFDAYDQHFRQEEYDAGVRLEWLNQVLLKLPHTDEQTLQHLETLQQDFRAVKRSCKACLDELDALQARFFMLVCNVGAHAGIPLPPPEAVDLMPATRQPAREVLQQARAQMNRTRDQGLAVAMRDALGPFEETSFREIAFSGAATDEHEVASLGESVRETYLAHVALAALANGELSEAERAFLARLATQLKLTPNQLTRALRTASVLTPEMAVDLAKQLNDKPATYWLALDMLLASLTDGMPEASELAVVAEVLELHSFSQALSRALAVLAAGIATGNWFMIAEAKRELEAHYADHPLLGACFFDLYTDAVDGPIEHNGRFELEAGTALTIDFNLALDRPLVVMTGATLQIRGATLVLSGKAHIEVAGELIVQDAQIQGSGDAREAMIESVGCGHVTLQRTLLMGEGRRGLRIGNPDALLGGLTGRPKRGERIIVENCVFHGCRSNGPGGAISLHFTNSLDTFQVRDSQFTECKAHTGGAISLTTSSLGAWGLSESLVRRLSITDCEFVKCQSKLGQPVNLATLPGEKSPLNKIMQRCMTR